MASFIPKIFTSSSSLGPTNIKRHTVKRILAVPPQHLYNIILDVNSYSSFLPYCQTSRIIRHSDCGTMFDAILKIGFGFGFGGSSSASVGGFDFDLFQEEYVSRVTKMKNEVFLKNDGNGGNHDHDHDTSLSLPSLEWTVNAKSIKSNLFDGLNSSWRLTEANNFDQLSTAATTTSNQNDNYDEIQRRNITNSYSSTSKIMTNVEFKVEISVSDPIIAAALDTTLEEVAKQQVIAFEKRSLEVPFQEVE